MTVESGRARARPRAWRPHPLTALALLWGLFIVYGTTLPFDFSAPPGQVAGRLRAIAADPWGTLSGTDAIANVLLFVPWGCLLAARLAGRGSGIGPALALATLGGSALSLAVEGAQLFAPTRTASPADLATNALGSALGALAGWTLWRRAWPRWGPPLRRSVGERPLAACAAAAVAGLVVAGLSPFDVSLDLADLRAAVRRARPVPFGPPLRGPTPPAEPWSWAVEALTWALAGGLAALALRESGRSGPRAVALAAALGAGAGLLIEVAQVAIPGRTADMTSVAFATAGSAVGAACTQGARGRAPRRWIGPALAIWAAAVILAAWAPPDFVAAGWSRLSWEQLAPFLAYYRRTDIGALADLIDGVLMFVPLGALRAAGRPRATVAEVAGIGLGFGLVLEIGQLFLIGRTADVTDALTAAAGAALGWGLWRWGEAARGPAAGHARYRVGAGAGRRDF